MSWDQRKIPIYAKWKAYWFATHPHDIAEHSWKYLFTGGKEIRARLFCELWKYLSPDLEPCGELAFAVECIHVASLILDDMPWMDNASERRGQTTLHLVFSEKKAILLCHDVMYMVYLIWNQNKPTHILQSDWEYLIKDKLQRLMIGQWYDLEKTGTLVDLASLKTGVLFELVTETVATCIQLDRPFWKVWGNHLGILFQWMDDWLDREEDIQQENRNAFNEAHDRTLIQYDTIWQKLANGIGAKWFDRPFGQFMKTYFTERIPLSATMPSYSLVDLEASYPTSILPYLKEILPEPANTPDIFDMIRDRSNVFMVNGKDIFQLEYNDILSIIRDKHPISFHINGKNAFECDLNEVLHLELLEILHTFNKNNVVRLTGKQVIRKMLGISQHVETYKETYMNRYMDTYTIVKAKLWDIDETQWEIQPEIIDFIYDEIQLMKEQRGIINQ